MSKNTGRSLKKLLSSWQDAVAGTSLPQPPAWHGPDLHLTAFVEHTGHVEEGTCFVARVRTNSDGHRFAARAAELGATLIIGQRPVADIEPPLPHGARYLQVQDTAITLAWLSAAWEEFPGRQLVIAGITGTDGKTTTANFLFEILRAAGYRAGLLSTVRAVIGGKEEPLALHVTTPEAPVVQRYLRRMVDAGLTHCVLEATSHALAQHRVDAVDFDLAIVTNITHEHLDYHGSFEAYFADKSRLFQMLGAEPPQVTSHNPFKQQLPKTAILNLDDSSYQGLAAIEVERQLTYSLEQEADVMARDPRFAADATRFRLQLPAQSINVSSPFAGGFNVYNMTAAAAAAHVLGVPAAEIKSGIEALQSLSGRMERIDEGQTFQVIVDFAHTPNGLEKAIDAARGMTDGNIITVFGSAGKRDVAKRRLMAEISARMADKTVLTAEDPRTESLDEILETMAGGCRSQGAVEGVSFWRVADRGSAIYHALSLAGRDDLVLVCGKGHEQSMCFGTTEYPWDDCDATRTALRAFLDGKPMPSTGLPTYSATPSERDLRDS